MYNMLQDQDVTAAYKSLTVTEELYKDCSKKCRKNMIFPAVTFRFFELRQETTLE